MLKKKVHYSYYLYVRPFFEPVDAAVYSIRNYKGITLLLVRSIMNQFSGLLKLSHGGSFRKKSKQNQPTQMS